MRDLFDDFHSLDDWRQAYNAKKKADRLDKIEEVREFLVTHPGAQARDVSQMLGFCYRSAADYIRILRAEWRGKK